jgi:hypothetical protein
MSGRPVWAFKRMRREYFKGLVKFINNEYFAVDK